MKIGYARVSTDEQNLDLQKDALRRAGCKVVFCDQGVSGTTFHRPGLERALRRLKNGGVLVVWRLDRLGRSLGKLVDLVAYLEQQNVKFESLTENISTDSSSGTLLFHMMAAMAQFERNLISERTKAGIQAAKARGKRLGRKPALTVSQQKQALALMSTQPITAVAQRFGVNPRTLVRMRDRVANEESLIC
ncbi:recombinase family protein [Burkholderia contaminans]|uniref:recombinase family protein n=1 Tax=Burkholderia contaminans TaxID=488447 RepID=UPI00241779B9|nr:recombinase family protein [Burkholderia contaminans]WFN14441.1 recombinase family protein [Burkholderia contaminans]